VRPPIASTPVSWLRRLWPTWWELVPEVVLVAGLTFFLVDETDAATSSFGSVRAVVLMVVVALAWIAGRIVLSRFVPWALARIGAFTAAAVAILAIVVLPAYDDDKVVETLPKMAAAMDDTAEDPAEAPAEEEAPAPAPFRQSTFEGIDHRAEGTVTLYRNADGSYVVGLERIDIQPGPDYDVYVVPGADREDRDGATKLDDLRGNQGTQYYAVPGTVNLEDGAWTVLIWCQTFGVPIANSTPA
jgi:anti-sigma factor RsiW